MSNQFIISLLFLAVSLLVMGCGSEGTDAVSEEEVAEPELKQASISFVPMPNINGREVQLYTLTNGRGTEVKITNYGGIITSIKTPDKAGQLEEITLGFDTLSKYAVGNPYFGALVGRYGNRIAKGKFTLEGKTYTLATNNMGNHLHGGITGFDKVFWSALVIERNKVPGLKLTYTSPDGEEGYPGNLQVTVIYSLNQENELKIDYTAVTDKPTIVNLTNHTYFNLTGNAKRDILGHRLTINADRFLPVDETLIPTGELRPVKGTPFDFTEPKAIGVRIGAENEQIKVGGGYDHCWVLNRSPASPDVTLAARVVEPSSGRVLEVYTSEPGIQFYSGNFLDGTYTGIGGVKYEKRYGFCLETQHFPDSPNQPDFPSTILRPGEQYETQTIFKFGVQQNRNQ